jgi:hypothetical protein
MRLPCCLLLLGATSQALAQAPRLEFRDIREFRGAAITTRPPSGDVPIVREPQATPGNARAAAPDASLGPAIARLGLDAQALLDATMLPVDALVPSGSPLVEFQMGDYAFRMAIVERMTDSGLDAVHYTLVDPLGGDYARMTISRSGPEIVGTVVLDREEYRILPEADGYQLVHPVTLFRGEFRRARSPDLETRSGRLEARHLQQAWVAERRPERFQTTPDGKLQMVVVAEADPAGLGRIDILAAMRIGDDGKSVADSERLASLVAAYMNDLAHLTLVDAPVAVRIDDHELDPLYDGTETEAEIEFTQLIDGIAVDEASSIELDGRGVVREIVSVLSQPVAGQERRNALDTDRAEALGRAAVIERYAIDWPLPLEASELFYLFSANDGNLELHWRVTFGDPACPLTHRAEVHAVTGEVTDTNESRRRSSLVASPATREATASTCRR